MISYLIRCIIRRIVNCIIRPKNVIKLIIIFLICFLFFNHLIVNNAFASTEATGFNGDSTYYDSKEAMFQVYEGFCADLCIRLNTFSVDSSPLNRFNANQIIKLLQDKEYGVWISYNLPSGDNFYNAVLYNRSKMYVTFYPLKSRLSFTQMPLSVWYLMDNIEMREIFYNSSDLICFEISSNVYVEEYDISVNKPWGYRESDGAYPLEMPFLLYSYNSTSISEFITAYFSNNTSQLEGILEQLEKTNDFLSSKDVPDSAFDIDSSSTKNEIDNSTSNIETTEGVDNIFTSFYNTFTDTSSTELEVPIPFVDKSLKIKGSFVQDFLGENNIILLMLHALYYYFVSAFIIKDMMRIIDKIKSGDIATSSETNIKADML